MERNIRVTGKGKLSVAPDHTLLHLSLTGTEKEYDEALHRSSVETEALRNLFMTLGFRKEELKTVHFDITTENESYRDPQGNYRSQFAGYRYNHNMKLEFPKDNHLLGRVLYALGHSDVCPEFWVEYTVKDEEEVKNRLLAKVVQDSRNKAEALTKAAGVTLGEIISMDYSWADMNLYVQPARMMTLENAPMNDGGSYDMDIEPENIDLNDSVTVIWSIA